MTNIYKLIAILYFGHWSGNHYSTNSFSSLHISSHHCTFCAPLHVKANPALMSVLHPKKPIFNLHL